MLEIYPPKSTSVESKSVPISSSIVRVKLSAIHIVTVRQDHIPLHCRIHYTRIFRSKAPSTWDGFFALSVFFSLPIFNLTETETSNVN